MGICGKLLRAEVTVERLHRNKLSQSSKNIFKDLIEDSNQGGRHVQGISEVGPTTEMALSLELANLTALTSRPVAGSQMLILRLGQAYLHMVCIIPPTLSFCGGQNRIRSIYGVFDHM